MIDFCSMNNTFFNPFVILLLHLEPLRAVTVETALCPSAHFNVIRLFKLHSAFKFFSSELLFEKRIQHTMGWYDQDDVESERVMCDL